MTPERKKWWDSLPQREKILRKQIEVTKMELSYWKYAIQIDCFKDKAKKRLTPRIKEQKVTLTALKHELDRSKVAKVKKSAAGEFYCDNCCQFVQRYDNYCAVCGRKLRWCGRKIEGCK